MYKSKEGRSDYPIKWRCPSLVEELSVHVTRIWLELIAMADGWDGTTGMTVMSPPLE
jgi:hypothetical protein